MTPGQMRLMKDSRLSDAARILGFYLSTLPAGPHEMKHQCLRVMLHNAPNSQTVGRHLNQLALFDYARLVSSGGKGSPVYEWIADSAAENSEADEVLPVNKQQEKPPLLVVGSESVDSPKVPKPELEASAKALIDSERSILGDCIKPLAGYLVRRVKPDRQEPYVGRVLSCLKPDCLNPPWKDATGANIPLARRPGILADALNELATVDEAKDRIHPVGDMRNLLNKVQGLCKVENAPPIASTGVPKPRRFNADPGPPALSTPKAGDELVKLQAAHPKEYSEEWAKFAAKAWWAGVNDDEKLRQMAGAIRERLTRRMAS